MKKQILILTLLISTYAFSQELSFNDIHKIVEAKKYDEAIVNLKPFLAKEPKHISANYDLSNCYKGKFNVLAQQQNENIKVQNKSIWVEKDYENNLSLWKSAISYTDSIVFYLQQTSNLMNIKFLTLDLRYPEFDKVTVNCGVIQKVSCARSYLKTEIDSWESTNIKNKAQLRNVEDDFDNFKKQAETKQKAKEEAERLKKEAELKEKLALEEKEKARKIAEDEAKKSMMFFSEKKIDNISIGMPIKNIELKPNQTIKKEILGNDENGDDIVVYNIYVDGQSAITISLDEQKNISNLEIFSPKILNEQFQNIKTNATLGDLKKCHADFFTIGSESGNLLIIRQNSSIQYIIDDASLPSNIIEQISPDNAPSIEQIPLTAKIKSIRIY